MSPMCRCHRKPQWLQISQSIAPYNALLNKRLVNEKSHSNLNAFCLISFRFLSISFSLATSTRLAFNRSAQRVRFIVKYTEWQRKSAHRMQCPFMCVNVSVATTSFKMCVCVFLLFYKRLKLPERVCSPTYIHRVVKPV